MIERPLLVGLSGSLRAASLCTAILQAAAEQIADRAELRLMPLGAIPLYNEDEDRAALPDVVTALRDAIRAADGVVIVTPEYNYGISGVLKNALDWASRPYGRSPLKGKPVLTISASPASTGGVRAQAQLSETLMAIEARLLVRPQIVIGVAHQKVRDGRLVDPATLKFVVDGLGDLLRAIDPH